jgi:hypothetical protein
MTRDSMWRIFRSVLQLIAGGGLTALLYQVAKDLPEGYAPYITLLSTGIIVVAQNAVEAMTDTKLIGPQVVSTKSADKAVEKAYSAVPGVDPMPTVKS